ncbi:MAG: SDR family oxidoreductase [Bryobacter sp.]|nr:SDR family oxidoreductase [Bryobacter sp. CoA8 C33]
MNWNLQGYRAVVTGGSQGIGRAIVEEYRRLGAEVMSVSLEEGVVADVATAEGREQVIASLPWETVDVLVNNVGTNVRKPTVEYTLAEYERVMATNATSMHELSRMMHPWLKRSGRGSVVNIGSVAGVLSVGSSAAYAMTKAAVAHLARYLAVEWAKDGIRVNAIAPGWVATALTEKIQQSGKAMRVIEERTPLGRMGRPEEIAAVAAFLAMEGASYLTGAVIPVDGAMSAYGMDMTAALRE